MTCLHSENVVVCVPSVDGWQRFFANCPVCKTRRLCLGEFQDWYGWRCTCLICGTGWMDGQYRKCGKRDRVNAVKRAKAAIASYLAAGIPQGLHAYMERLEVEFGKRKVTTR